MEPVINPADAAKVQKKRKHILLFITIFIITILASGAAIYWYLEQNSPQQRLYRAFENALGTKYVNKKVTYHRDGTGDGTNFIVDSSMDLSNPSSVLTESKIEFSRQIKRNGKVTDDQYSARIIKTTKLNVFVESYSGVTDLTGLEKNKWLVSELTKKNIPTSLEEFDVSMVIYGYQIVPAMGNYDGILRGKIMDMIKANGMFKVIDTTAKEVNGKSLTGMKISLDRTAINKLHKLIAAELGSEQTHALTALVNNTNYEDLTLWLDGKDTIVEVDYRNRLQNEDKFRITSSTVFAYPNEIKINEPNRE